MNATITESTHVPRFTVMFDGCGRFYARYQFATDESARQYIKEVCPDMIEGVGFKIIIKPYAPRVRKWTKWGKNRGRYVESGIEQAQCSQNLAWRESRPTI